MQRQEEIAHHGVIDGALSRILPRGIRRLIILKNADNIDAIGVAEFVAIEAFEFAAEYEVKVLRRGRRCGLGHGGLSSPEQWLRTIFQRPPGLVAVNGGKRP